MSRCFALVPAAGVGRRMGSDVPKQYLNLAGRSILAWTLERLLAHSEIAGVTVALSAGDQWWPGVAAELSAPVTTVSGGAERCHSVLSGLRRLAETAEPDDWVLVHDAVRPCVRHRDIHALIERVDGHAEGGILGLPVRDTMKRTGEHDLITATVDRDNLWHGLTPQMFRIGALIQAIERALANGVIVTDEAQAMELAGVRPVMVAGHADNIKITRPGDLPLAEWFLTQGNA